jgi:hypothetical protein
LLLSRCWKNSKELSGLFGKLWAMLIAAATANFEFLLSDSLAL